MTNGNHGAALRQLRTLLERGSVGQLSDAELIDRFLSGRDEPAFAALVERHGPAVFRVCRSVLGDAESAQDAFQATFLVLVRKAGSVRVRDSIGPWLVAVAYRTASGARSDANRRRIVERDAAEARASRDLSDDELAEEVRAEVDRLADRYRRPILLCYFAGLTHEGAARQLGCPVGTVRSRLAWGRKQLRERLIRRGVVPSIVFGSLAATSGRAAVPTTLLIRTARAAPRLGANEAVSAGAVVQAERVVRAMFMTKLKGVAAALLTLSLAATGGGVLAQQQKDNPGPLPAAERPFTQMELDDISFELTAMYQKPTPSPKVRPDVEIEMLLRAAREQEQAGHLDQALALMARMETALQEWRTKLNPPTRATNEAPQNYIKRLVDLPHDIAMPIAKPAPKPDQSKDTPAGNQRENLDRQGAASQQDGRAKVFKDYYTLHQPYTLQSDSKPRPKDATSWALGVTVPTPIYDRTNGANRKGAGAARPDGPPSVTGTTNPPAEERRPAASRERPGDPEPNRAGAHRDDGPDRALLTLDDAQQVVARFQRGRLAPSPGFTRAQLTAELERKIPLTVRCNSGIVAAIKTIQRAYTGPDGPVPIFFDLKGQGKAEASLLKSVVLDAEGVPLGTALKMAPDQVGLAYQVEDGGVMIVAPRTDPTAPAKP